ncbi:MAG: DNA translocase FtsK [Coriobacteriia bacterium]|nr:DNA translocase FtsK [Coriobacteriia bacterium]
MSAQKATNSKKKGSSTAKKKSGNGSANLSKAPGTKSQTKNQEKNPPILDLRLKRELIGIFIAVIAIVLFIAVIAPGTAFLPRLVSDAFLLSFGMGSYVLPFLLFIWAVSFFVERSVASSTLRLVSGLIIIFISALSLIALSSPGAKSNPDLIFNQAALMSHGGYVGGGVTWALLNMVGEAISIVILIGLVVVGAVLIGFSITGMVNRILSLLANRRAREDSIPLPSAYDLEGTRNSQGRSGKRSRDKLIAPTAQLSVGFEPTRQMEVDYSHGNQGRIPLEALDGLGGLEDLGDLGSTRRMLADTADTEDATAPLGSPSTAQQTATQKRSARATGVAASASSASASTAFAYREPPFKLPDLRLLKVSRNKAATKAGESELRQTAAILQDTIDQFGVDAQVQGWVAGPTVTLFKVSLGEGVRLNKINALDEDIALALAAPAVRIFSPIPGTTLVGIEVPNVNRSMILLGDVLPDSPEGPLQLAIGKDVEGSSIVANLEKMPHLLIGGTTGSGKSVAINSMIMSILMRATPHQVRMILIDPKMVELSLYNDIPHLYVPVVTDAQKAASALAWGVLEMERRLKLFQKAGVKNIEQYNVHVCSELEKLAQAAAQHADEKDAADNAGGAEPSQTEAATRHLERKAPPEEPPEEMPMIVIVIDELADLMMIAGKDVETSISRLAQLARAAGLHLIIATQRPSTNVITGLIKANIVNRIAFSVASGIDSRVIIDGPGAEDLIGNGDLLFSRPEYGKPQRIQGCYVSEPEIEAVVDYLKEQAEPEYHEDILSVAVGGMSISMLGSGDGGEDDPLIWEAADIIVSSGFGSTSTLQRRLKVGYARAGRIMDMLEQKGIVGPPNGSKPREVLFDDVLELESLKAIEASDEW